MGAGRQGKGGRAVRASRCSSRRRSSRLGWSRARTWPRTRSSTRDVLPGARASATLRLSGRDSITMAATRRSRGLRATNNAANATQGRGIGLHHRLRPGQVYAFGADLRFPPGQARTGSALMKLVFLREQRLHRLQPNELSIRPRSTPRTSETGFAFESSGVPEEDDGSIALVARLIKNEAGGSNSTSMAHSSSRAMGHFRRRLRAPVDLPLVHDQFLIARRQVSELCEPEEAADGGRDLRSCRRSASRFHCGARRVRWRHPAPYNSSISRKSGWHFPRHFLSASLAPARGSAA